MRIISARLLAAILCLGIPASMLAQTPQPKMPSGVTMTWLKSVAVSPASVAAGGDATGTVTLLRPAVQDLTVSISITGGQQIEGGFWGHGGILVDGRVTVPAGADRGTFWVRTSPSGDARTVTIVARYAKESRSTSFATTRP